MSQIHVATSTPKAREMVEVVLAEFDRWAKHAPSQVDDPQSAVAALADVRAELMDHLVIQVGITIESWGS